MHPYACRLLALAAVATIAALLPAATALAQSRWTATETFSVGKDYEPAPRAAIAPDGRSAVTWRSKTGKLMLSTGTGAGRFTAPRVIDRAGAGDFSIAVRRSGGGFVVAWHEGDAIRVAVRTLGGRAITVRRVATSNGEAISGVEVAADPLGGWVLAERQFRRSPDRLYHVRTLTLTPSGRPQGEIQELGPGQFGVDARQTMALAFDTEGRALLAFKREAPLSSTTSRPVVVSTRPHGGAFSTPVELGGDVADDPRLAIGQGGRALLAATQVRSRGDAGVFGNPVVARVGPAGELGAPFGPAIANPQRAFNPSAAMLNGSAAALVFQLKTSAQPFVTEAPVRAVSIDPGGGVGSLQTLTSGRAKEPVVMPLLNGRAVAIWSGRRGLGTASAGPTGAFQTTTSPKGPPPEPFHSNSTNRDLRTGGGFAIFAWARETDGRVRVSVREFIAQ